MLQKFFQHKNITLKDQINIIPSNKIDIKKWNDCIASSTSPLIYAYSYYLDHMADNWSGIVCNDYEAVMPICWRKKAGIKYSYDVPFIQQLGSFQKSNIQKEEILLQHFFSFVKYGDYSFNYTFNYDLPGIEKRINYILDLSQNHRSISSVYKTDLSNNLKKAAKEKFKYDKTDHSTAVDLYKELYHSRMQNILKRDFTNFKKLCNYLEKRNQVIVRKVTNKENETLAIALLLTDEQRLYNIMNSSTAAGRKTEANHFLFDNIFKEFAGSNLVFDFEGSDIPGVKSFYKKFGGVNQPYYWLHFNKLPFPLNKLKR